MLTILGQRHQHPFCDGLTRRGFLRIGGPGAGRADAAADSSRRVRQSACRNPHKAVIMIFLPGGPPHQDMFDLKMDAPAEIRGEFKPIKTNVPGIEICEHLPRIAAMMDKFVDPASIVGATGDHDAFQCLTGRPHQRQPQGGWPAMGSVLPS